VKVKERLTRKEFPTPRDRDAQPETHAGAKGEYKKKKGVPGNFPLSSLTAASNSSGKKGETHFRKKDC